MTNQRRRLEGVVTRTKLEKTITVRVDRSSKHPLYHKIIRTSKNYLVHDVLGCQIGDRVRIVETRPISRRKHFAVETILRRAEEAEVLSEQIEVEDAEEALS